MKGLIGRPELEPGTALVISPATQVHSFLLRYPIDVALCDAEWRVLWIGRSMSRNRLSPWRRKSRYAVEMRAGSLPEWLDAGARLSIVE
jgi:hypothetical protein